MSDNKILIVDAFSLAYRAFFAIPPTLTLDDGTPINAIFGFSSILFRTIDQLKPSHVCICFDRKEPTFRHIAYPEYKAHRPPPAEEFIVQIPLLKDILNNYGFLSIEKPGFEADDLMGTISLIAENNKFKSFLLTGDHDAFQLISENTEVVMGQRGTQDLLHYTPEKVKEKYDVWPNQIIELKALKGDASDNIPGVPGVGDKTAAKLLNEHGSIDGIFQNLDQLKSKKLQEKFSNNKDLAYLSKQLVTIDRAVEIDFELFETCFTPDWATIIDLFKSHRFNTLVSRYQSRLNQSEPLSDTSTRVIKSDGEYILINSISKLKTILKNCENGFAVDLETTSLDVHNAEIVGVALSYEEKQGVYIPLNEFLSANKANTSSIPLFAELEEDNIVEFKMNPFLDLLKPLLEDESISKYTHNGKYEINVLKNYGISLNGISFDTMIAAHLLFPNERLGLKDLSLKHCNIEMTSYEFLAGKGKDQISFDLVDINDAVNYAAADADLTYRLFKLFKPLINEKKLNDLFYKIELPTQNSLALMEREGVSIDGTYLGDLEKEFQEKLIGLSEEIYTLSGSNFNINSPKQLAEVLFDKLEIPVVKKTKTGRSTDSSVLEKLKKDYPIAEKLLDYRKLEKLQGTYVKALPELINIATNRIHTSFNQTIAITGRLSSTKPNLQNIPIRSEDGMRIRAAFVPSRKDGYILSVDYSQIELRMMAHFSEDENMVKAFCDDLDIHTATAALIYDVDLNDVSKEQRYNAKAVNFGISYGQSAFGLSETIGVSRKEAKDIIDSYFAKFPKLQLFMEDTIKEAHKKGCITTMFGRVRPLPELNEPRQRQFGERMAVNTRVQGSAAEIMKIAMVNIMNKMIEHKFNSRMVIQVHDELVFDIHPDEKHDMDKLVRSEMEQAIMLKVPLKVDAVFGKNWQEIS